MNDTYQPSPDDVEAAAKAIIEQGPIDVHWQISYLVTFLVPCAMRSLHARGWRDPAEVAAIEKERSEATFALTTAKLGWLIGAMPVRPDIHDVVCRRLEAMTAARDALAMKVQERHATALRSQEAENRAIARAEKAEAERDGYKRLAYDWHGNGPAAEARAARLAAALDDLHRRVCELDTSLAAEGETISLIAAYPKSLLADRVRQALAADTAEKETRE